MFDMKAFLEFIDKYHPKLTGMARDGSFVLLAAVGEAAQFRMPTEIWDSAVNDELVEELVGPGTNAWGLGDPGYAMLKELQA